MNKYSALILLVLFTQGCASFMTSDEVANLEKELTPQAAPIVNDAPASVVVSEIAEDEAEPMNKYSELSNMAPPSDRQYKKMTRKKMEEESELYSSAGSLWKMEGQSSYLFTENKHRRAGDPTTIKLEGSALKMIENKMLVITDLLKQLEEQKIKSEDDLKTAESEKMRLAQKEEEKKFRAESIARGEIVVDAAEEATLEEQLKVAEAKTLAESRKPASISVNKKNEKEEKFDLKEIELIPSKIVEKMTDDTYRIRGQQYLTIKKKPYKVIATALIRTEDFNDAGVSSNKLLDAQYDVIHVKRVNE